MFFQPKFYRGNKAIPPARQDSIKDRSEGIFSSTQRQYTSLSALTGRQAAVETVSKRPESRRQWIGGDYSLKDAREAARTEYFDPQYRPSSRAKQYPDYSCPSPLPPLPPISPLRAFHVTPHSKPHATPRTPSHTYAAHSTTPSLSSGTSQSSSSHGSLTSDALLTPVRSFLHPPLSPALSLAPSRPLPPPPSVSPPRLRSFLSSSGKTRSLRSLKAAPAGLYASMPLPPLPSADRRPSTPSSPCLVSSLAPPRADFLAKRSNRDSQATVRPRSRYPDSAAQSTPHLPLPPPMDDDSHVHIRDAEAYEYEDGEFDIPDFNLLSVFPMPPARSFTYTPSIKATARRPSAPSVLDTGVRPGGKTCEPIARAKSLASRSIRLPGRKAPPPPLPKLSFDDLFAISPRSQTGSGAGRQGGVSEADRIREQYLRGRNQI